MLIAFSYAWSAIVGSINIIVPTVIIGVILFIGFKKIPFFKPWQIRLPMIASVVIIFLIALLVKPAIFEFPPFIKSYGPGISGSIPFKNVAAFFKMKDKMDQVADIAQDPNAVPPAISRTEPATVKFSIETKEVIAEMAPGVVFNYWTFDGKIPGPMLRVREGDMVELTLKNSISSVHGHNIDLHAVTGPGGGAAVTDIGPGESKTLKFKALNPGLYVYHCAHPNVPAHMAHGMYGMILVEPKEGLPKVDKEFYVMQGDFYAVDPIGTKGLQIFDAHRMLDGLPTYIVFNGKTNSLTGNNMKAKVGDKVRIYFGNGSVSQISSFHVIGEIFDTVYPEAAIGSEPHKNIQTTTVPAGGATIVEFGLEVPGNNILVDHALSRMDRGAWGVMKVEGEPNKEVYDGVTGKSSGH